MEIKIKYHLESRKIEKHGNWIDLYPRKSYFFKAPQPKLNINTEETEIIFDGRKIDLGISMKLPKFVEAWVVPRSSTYTKQGLIQSNHKGIIDDTFCGEKDIWMFPAIALKETIITPDKAVCQFRLQLSQDAPFWMHIKWIFTKIKFKEVDVLTGPNRGGFGHTDTN